MPLNHSKLRCCRGNLEAFIKAVLRVKSYCNLIILLGTNNEKQSFMTIFQARGRKTGMYSDTVVILTSQTVIDLVLGVLIS